MEKLPMCRVCLAEDVRMHAVVNKNLLELYERLTNNPFITEDNRPMLVCFLCFTKLKQCCRFQNKCLEAEKRFAQMKNEDYEPKPLINQDHLECFNRFIQSPMVHVSIVDECQTESDDIEEELPAVCERPENINEPKEEHESDGIEDMLAQQSESKSEDNLPLEIKKIEVEEVRASDTQQLELENINKSYSAIEDMQAQQSETGSGDNLPLMEIEYSNMKVLENIFDDAKNITMFRRDGYSDKYKINLNKFIGKGKLKILSNNGIDITYKNKNFISDVIFTKEKEDFIANIDIDQYNDKLKKLMKYSSIHNNQFVDYKKEEYWPLTYKIRGYDVKFYCTKCDMGKSNDSFLTWLILYILRKKGDDWDETVFDIDEIMECLECDEKEELEKDTEMNIFTYIINKYNLLNSPHLSNSNIQEICSMIIKNYDDIESSLPAFNNILLIEYKDIGFPNFKYEQYKINNTNILDIHDLDDDTKYCTIIFLDSVTSPDMTDLWLRSDEGWYHAGVNVYENGIVMLGQQNSFDSMSYAIAVNVGIVVPDVMLL